jgi:hypothetical protein
VALTSASTDAQVEAAYDDNADYDSGSGSVTKARDYQQACRFLLRRYPTTVGAGGTSLGRDTKVLQDELKRVDEWLNLNDSARNTSQVTVADLREARR